jgi:hypothetical protein
VSKATNIAKLRVARIAFRTPLPLFSHGEEKCVSSLVPPISGARFGNETG